MKLQLLRGVSISTLLTGLTYLAVVASPTGLGQSGAGAMPQAFSGSAAGEELVTAIAPAHVGAAGTAMMASAILSNGLQQIVVYDPTKTTVAVYHVSPSSGDIQLKSVRRIDADFSLQEFNLKEPTPSTIRKHGK